MIEVYVICDRCQSSKKLEYSNDRLLREAIPDDLPAWLYQSTETLCNACTRRAHGLTPKDGDP